MAALCDVYVSDAFGTAHRAEATTHRIAKFARSACAGPLLAAELDALGAALKTPKRPMVAIVAGSTWNPQLDGCECMFLRLSGKGVAGNSVSMLTACETVCTCQCRRALQGRRRRRLHPARRSNTA